jgi:hypothetical protein
LASVERCTNHTFEIADRLCGDCGRPYCDLCMVKPFRRRPPLCHQCAVAAAGIRKGARPTPVRSRKEIKAFERERREAEGRPEPATPSEGGFGPAKPAFTPGPARTPSRVDAAKPAPSDAEDAEPAPEHAAGQDAAATTGRNRPLWGLSR